MINGCVRGDKSRSWKLAEAFLEEMSRNAPGDLQYEQLDLAEMDFKPLVGDFFEAREALLAENNREHERFRFAHQFAEADLLLIAAPFWDLSVPAVVKLYIENVSVDGITFCCDGTGMHGMCRAKECVFFTTRGSVYGDGALEHGASYLKALCEMFGIHKFSCVYAEGIDAFPEKRDELMRRALERAREAGKRCFEYHRKGVSKK